MYTPFIHFSPTSLLNQLSELLLNSVHHRKSGQAVLVHCKMGISRSGSTVIAYAMKQQHWPLDVALAYVRERRSIVNPNDGFMKQLQTYNGILNARFGIHERISIFIVCCCWWLFRFVICGLVPHHSSQQRHSTLWRRKSRDQRQKSVNKEKGGEEGKPDEEEEEEEEEDEEDEGLEEDEETPDEKDDSEEETEVISYINDVLLTF